MMEQLPEWADVKQLQAFSDGRLNSRSMQHYRKQWTEGHHYREQPPGKRTKWQYHVRRCMADNPYFAGHMTRLSEDVMNDAPPLPTPTRVATPPRQADLVMFVGYFTARLMEAGGSLGGHTVTDVLGWVTEYLHDCPAPEPPTLQLTKQENSE